MPDHGTIGDMVKLNRIQQAHLDENLCQDHVDYFGMPEGTYTLVRSTDDLGPDDPIECDTCSLSKMRALGVV